MESSGIFRTLRILLLETNQGALRMGRRTLDWNLWMRAIFAAFVDPHTSMAIYFVERLQLSLVTNVFVEIK